MMQSAFTRVALLPLVGPTDFAADLMTGLPTKYRVILA